MAEEQKFISITIEGLSSQSDDGKVSKLAQCEMTLNVEAPISEIWTKIEELGYIRPAGLFDDGPNPQCWYSDNTKIINSTDFEVAVVGTEEPSNYHQRIININDTLISFANQPYQGQSQLRFELQPESHGARGAGAQRLVVDGRLEIVFHRTLRMPDDDRLHQLPASLGNFPLFNVEEHVGRLPPNIEEQGGIFFPMWQREAMWISFHIKDADPDLCYAVRISVGHVNAITGLPMNEANRRDEYGISRQDYIVVPGQPWIDGICVAAGVVRQFVAMPLGSGYSVEGQITGEEKFGGLQVEVIPSYRRHLKMWGLAPKPGEPKQVDFGHRAEYHTPASLGLKPSDKLRTYSYLEVPLKISDLPQSISSDKIRLFDASHDAAKVRGTNPYTDELECLPVVPEVSNPPRDDFGSKGLKLIRRKNHLNHQSSKTYARLIAPIAHSARRNDNSDKLQDNDKPIAPILPAYACSRQTWKAKKDLKRKSNSLSQHNDDTDTHQANDVSSTLHVKARNLRAMGLAAGGKMIQDIVRDNNTAEIWNLQNATLVNVHILDPTSCEQVTHIIQEPPIDAQAYVHAGLPFFVVEENVENRLNKGDFDQVVSVSEMDQKVGITTEPGLDFNKPKMCEECSLRLCDCIIRPCKHQFCNVCIRKLESVIADVGHGRKHWKCPRCDSDVRYVAGFSAPMNLPGEETLKANVPVTVLKASSNGRPVFQSIYTTRI